MGPILCGVHTTREGIKILEKSLMGPILVKVVKIFWKNHNPKECPLLRTPIITPFESVT